MTDKREWTVGEPSDNVPRLASSAPHSGPSYMASPTSVMRTYYVKKGHSIDPVSREVGRVEMALELLTVAKTLEVMEPRVCAAIETFLEEVMGLDRVIGVYDALNEWRVVKFVPVNAFGVGPDAVLPDTDDASDHPTESAPPSSGA